MERYYKDHHISARAELDPANDLYRAAVIIKTVLVADDFGRRLRHPDKGTFSNDSAAELHGLLLAKDWIDQITSKIGR